MSNSTLNYTVPFLTYDNIEPRLIIDRIGIKNENSISKSVFNKIISKLELTEVANVIPNAIAIDLIQEQYEVCLNYIFSNPIWEKIRSGNGKEILLGYIIENRHYLYAAASRMSAGIGLHSEIKPYSFILSEHLIEEADHAVFFENSLKTLGCDRQLIKNTKPSPITLEWIYLMRTLSAKHPLVSAACSGLMESSAKDQKVVKNWHDMLIESEIIDAEAVKKFYRHVELDIELGHGSCWEEAILSAESITPEILKECLNSITLVADQLYRWSASLDSGLSGNYVDLLPKVKRNQKIDKPSIDNFYDGYPIFSSNIYHSICYNRRKNTKAVSQIISLSYFLGHKIDHLEFTGDYDIGSSCKEIILRTQADEITSSEDLDLLKIVESWMRSIDGHQLWDEMIEHPTSDLIYGYIFENYHYLNSSVSHTSAAIYSCTNQAIRESLIKHLSEEEKHSELLGKSLSKFENEFISFMALRPLSTTVLFTGFLKELALTDWKAYCLALSFLQLTIENNSDKHENFYSEVINGNPKIKELLMAIRQHDILDAGLDHTNDIRELLSLLESVGISNDSIRRASQICSLTWSFLDGIRAYYRNNNSVNARIGWITNGESWN